MKNLILCLCCLGILSSAVYAADDIKISGVPLAKFATGPNGTFTSSDLLRVFLIKKYPELKSLLRTNDAALNDPNLSQMVASAAEFVATMQMNLPGPGPYSYEAVQKAYLGHYPTDNFSLWNFKLRQSWEEMSVSEPETNYTKAKPASVSFSRDFIKNSSSWTVHGALMYSFSKDLSGTNGADPGKNLKFTAYSLTPSVSLDKVTGVKQPIDSLVFRFANEDEFAYNNAEIGEHWITTHLIRISPFYATDTHFKSSQAGGEVEYEPINDDWLGALTVRNVITPRFRIFLHTEGGNVIDAGGNPNLTQGKTYFRIGPDVALDLHFGTLKALVFSARVQDYEAVTSQTRATRLFTGDVTYNIDPQGHVAIQAEYKEGRIPLSAERAKLLTLGLGLKF